MRALSKLVFSGALYRIEIGAAIADREGIANIAELAEQLGLQRQSVNNELKRLEDAGLLHRTERRDHKIYLMSIASGYWALCQELRDRAATLLDSVERY